MSQPYNRPIPIQLNSAIAQFEIGPLKNLVYLIISWSTQSIWIVDPQKDLGPIEQALRPFAMTLEKNLFGIVLTHSHHDHVAGIPKLLEMNPNLPLYMHSGEAFRLPLPFQQRAQPLEHNQNLQLGEHKVSCLHTPGHSRGGMCYWLKPFLLTGDTLFIRDCGRTDFETGSTPELFNSLQFIKTLPDSTLVLPGHHYAPEFWSNLGIEKLSSPPLLAQSSMALDDLP